MMDSDSRLLAYLSACGGGFYSQTAHKKTGAQGTRLFFQRIAGYQMIYPRSS